MGQDSFRQARSVSSGRAPSFRSMKIEFRLEVETTKDEKALMQIDWAQWRKHSSVWRSKLKLPKTSRPWTGKKGRLLKGVPRTERATDLIDIAFAHQMAANPGVPTAEAIRSLWVDLATSVERSPWGESLTTARQNTIYSSFAKDSVLSGASNMALLGWPRSACIRDEFTKRELRSLAGEGYSLPWAGVLNYLLYANPHAPWWA